VELDFVELNRLGIKGDFARQISASHRTPALP
jgi:hypothetical protein